MGELIYLKIYNQVDDFGDFRISYRFEVIRKGDFLKSDLLIDLKSYILRKSDFLSALGPQVLIYRPHILRKLEF